jgi:predicted glycosyltransferase
MANRRESSGMKVLMYSHDSYGLGHLRRTLALAEAFVERDPGTSVLILSGSTVSHAYKMSPGIDLVKVPSAVKVDNGVYEPERLPVSFDELRELRSGIILSALRSFVPDAFVVDKAPLGMKREVLPALEYLRGYSPTTLTVLGLRDVMDDPEYVRRSWEKSGVAEAIERFYDLILVYGPREIYDPLPLYGLSRDAIARSRYVGYVGRPAKPRETGQLPFHPGYVLVTAGGGGDGFRLIEAYLKGLRLSEPGYDSLVVTGPLMEEEDREKIDRLARGVRASVVEFRADMEQVIQGAGAVVAMGGYNTTIELLAARKRAVIVPRVEPRVEQLIRARCLSELGLMEMIHPHDLTPHKLRGKVEELLSGDPDPKPAVEVDFSGAACAVELVRNGVAAKRAAQRSVTAHAMRMGA